MRDVLVVGAGPVGLLLACLLNDRGLDVEVWEPRGRGGTSRAIGVHAPALVALEGAGVSDEIVDLAVRVRRGVARSRGRTLGVVPFARASARYPFVATLPQRTTEQVLVRRLAQLGPREQPVRLTGLTSLADRVVASGEADAGAVQAEACVVVAADGARSTVRRLLGVPARGREYPDTFVMGDFADVTADGSDAAIHLEPGGVVESLPLPGGRRRFVARSATFVADPRPEDLARVVTRRAGLPVDPATNTMMSGFRVRRRIVDRMVHGRVVLIGDAAHEISPIGGQGMNLGWLDAAGLAAALVTARDDVRSRRLPVGALEHLGRERLRSARFAAHAAEANMALGRPAGPARCDARDLALAATLRSPARHVLAALYAMRWA